MFSRQENYGIPIWCIRLVAALSHSSTLSFRMPIHFRCGTSNILHTQHHMVNSITRKPEAIFVIFINICSERNLFFVQSFSLMLYLFMNFLLLQWKRNKKNFLTNSVFIAIVIWSWIASGLEWLFCANTTEAKCLCNGRCRYQKILDSYLFWTSKSFQG